MNDVQGGEGGRRQGEGDLALFHDKSQISNY